MPRIKSVREMVFEAMEKGYLTLNPSEGEEPHGRWSDEQIAMSMARKKIFRDESMPASLLVVPIHQWRQEHQANPFHKVN